MRRILFLLFTLFPVFLFSQDTKTLQNETQNTEGEISIQKADLIGLDVNQLIDLGFGNIDNINASHPQGQTGSEREECFDPYIWVDPATYTPVPRNDDGSLYLPNLGFEFSFCGSSYTDCYINTNGNISFGSAVAQYSPDGFPFGTPMVAPFWADVDTRNLNCGQAWYQLFPNYLIVSWELVGWYNQQCDPLNTFQCIISDGTAPIIGVGNNIQFRYDDMNWTTGTASGGGPFGGFPATVGYNSGDNVNFEQVGRFNVNDSSYDGPFGANDGVHWLDYKCFVFNAGVGSFTLDCIDITRSLDANCEVNITVEEVAEAISSGCSAVDLSLDISSFNCNNLGSNTVTITADSGNETVTCTVNVDILEGGCTATAIDPVDPLCEENAPITLTANPTGGTWGGSAPGGIFDPSALGPGSHEVTYSTPLGCPATASLFITVNESPLVVISPAPAEFCENDGFVELTAAGSGGNGIYSYNWTTPYGNQIGQTILASEAGSYTVTVSDGSGCSSNTTTNVTVNPTPIVDIAYQEPICNSESVVQLTATPPGGIWTGDYVTQDGFIFPLLTPPGYIQVSYSYTNNFGCEASADAEIEILESPDAQAFNNGPYCEGQTIELFGSTSSQVIPTYNWTGPNGYTSDQQDPIDATEPGSYFLETSLNGCTSEPAETVVVVSPAPTATAGNNGPLCEGQPIILFGVATPMGIVNEYQWNGPNGYISTEANPSDATDNGVYTLIVTVDGCPSEPVTTTVDFTAPPEAVAVNTGPYCSNSAIALMGSTSSTGTVITYSWTGPNGYVSIEQNPSNAFDPGVYFLEISVDGCLSDMASTEVIINSPPMPTITGDDTFCEGDFSILDAGGGYSIYLWSTGDGDQSILVGATGVFNVTVTDANGCTGEASYFVTENPSPEPAITGSTSFCTGTSTLLDAGPGFDIYAWSNGESTQSVSVSSSGVITVTVTDANGCTGEDMVDITENDQLSPIITGDLDLCDGESTVLDVGNGYTTYEWSEGSNTPDILVSVAGDYTVTVTDANGCTGEATVSLVVNDLPSPIITGDNAFCEGASASLDAGSGYDIYEWSQGGGTQTISISTTGTYIVTVTDANGCTGEAQFNVTQNQNPDPTITGDNAFCEGGSVMLDAGSGYNQYEWSETSNTQTITISTGDTYSVTVTDANGCTGETQFTVTENSLAPPTISGLTAFCEGDNSILDAGAGYSFYDWSNNTSNQTITVSTAGTYSVTVTDANGCTAENQVEVTINTNLSPEITGTTAFCVGSSSTLDAGTGYDIYEWSNNTNGQTITVSTSGTYSVTVTDASGCTGEDEINIIANPNPNPSIAGSTSFCTGFSTILDAGSYSAYEWSDMSNGQTLEVSQGGTYSVTVTNANGCTGVASLDVVESSSLNPNISGDLDYCVGNNTTLNVGAGYVLYEWSNGSGDQSITVSSPDDYSVTVTDANGCSGETTVTVIENQLPALSISGNNPICSGASLTLDAGAGFDNYSWSNSSLNQTIQVASSGAYSVTVTDANGCTNEDTVNVQVNPNPQPVITGDQSFCAGETVTLDAGTYDQYEWSDNSNLSTLDISSGGTYSVTVTDGNGCTGIDQFTATVNQLPAPQITGDLEFCAGSSTSLSGPNGFEYLWSNGDTLQTININIDGNIGLTVTNANGCSGETSVMLVENPNPNPQITGSTTFCVGNSTIIDAGGGYNLYEWSNGTFNQTLQVTVEGSYTVTVTNSNGCTGMTQTFITESQSLQPLITGDDNICEGETSTLDAGSGFATYLWSNNDTTQTITVNTASNYSVTVSDSQGCTGENSFSLAVNQNPSATITGTEILCEGEVSTLDAGSGYDTYLWSTSEITQTIDVNTSGAFSVTVTNTNGCNDNTQINITVNPNPDPTITGPASFCEGNTATLDAGAGYDNYFWSTGESTQFITVSNGDLYSVTVTTTEGCTGETSTDVIENSSLTPIIIGDLDFCDGDNTILDAGSGYATYEWSNGDFGQTITVTQGGNYGVLVTDTDGCSGTANVSVTAFQNPNPIIAGSTTFCSGSSTTLDAGNYSSFSWSNGDTTQTIVVDNPGNYTVEVVDGNGCTGTASANVTESTSLSPVISGLPAYCTGETTILDAGAGFMTYVWSNGSITQTIEVGVADDYSVTVSDASGCTGTTMITVIENTPPEAALEPGTSLCNTDAGGSVTNLYDLIISGDNSGSWEDTDNSGAFGLYDNLNFDGIAAGDYTFTYTTNSAVAPCQEVSYPVIVTILDCACPTVSFNAVDPLCNSNGTMDLNNVLNTSETGTWTIITTPGGTSPASVNGQLFDAISADAGDYELQFELTDMPPTGCPSTFIVSISVENEVFAGTAAMPMDFCEDEIQVVPLSDLLTGEEANGVWTETSGSPSQGGAFDPNAGSFNMTGQNSGTYTFEYTISPGGACPDDSEEVTVIINELPTAIAGSSVELNCASPILSLNAAGSSEGPGFEIQWSGGVVIDGNENTISPTVNQAGVYTLTITNSQTGCMATDQVQVTESDDIPDSFAGNDDELTCNETEVTLSAGGSVGSGFEVLWDGPSITSANMNDINPIVDLAGEYILIVTNTDNGCVSSPDTVIVFDNTAEPDVVIQTPLSIDCNNPEVGIIGNASIPNANYEWFYANVSIGIGDAINGINTPGFYTLVVTDNQTGCTGFEIIEVFQDTLSPVANAGNPQLINCYDPVVTLDGSGSQNGPQIEYNWSGPSITGNPDSVTITTNQAGTYTLSVFNNINGCESVATILVEENTTPPVANILQPDQLDCTIDEVTLDGSGSSNGANYSYTWLDEQGSVLSTGISINVQTVGTYFLTVQDTDNGCETTTDAIVSESTDVPNSVAFQINNPDCFGDNDGNIAVLEVSGGMPPYMYSVNGEPFSATSFYTGLTPGSYDFLLQDANGCEWDTIINIYEPAEVTINLGTNLELEMGDSAIVQAQINIPIENIDTILWSPANLINCGDPECLEIGFSSFYTQNVTATLIDIYGCTDEDDITVFMDRDRRVFIPNVFSPNGDSFNDLFMIFGDDKHVVKINKFIVFNRWGEVVHEGLNFKPNDPDYGWNGTLRGELMNPAVFVYLAEIEFLDGEVILYKGDVTLVR